MFNPADAMGRLKEMRQIIGIGGVGNAMIRGRGHAVDWIVEPRQLIEGDELSPFVSIIPAVDGKQRRMLAFRELARKGVADIAVAISVDEIQTGRAVPTQCV